MEERELKALEIATKSKLTRKNKSFPSPFAAPVLMLGVMLVISFGWIIRHRGKKKRYLPRGVAWEQTWMCLHPYYDHTLSLQVPL